MSDNKTHLTISNRDVVRIVVVAMAAIAGVSVVQKLSHVLTLIFVAFFLAIALNPAVAKITKWLPSKSRVRATGVAYLLVLTIIIGFLALVVPPLVNQTRQFINDVPEIVSDFKNADGALPNFIRSNNLDDEIEKVTSDITSRVKRLDGPILSTAGRLGSTLVSVITVLVLCFMMLIEGPGIYHKFWQRTPGKFKERWEPLLKQMQDVVVGYVNGQLIICVIAGFFSLLVMLLIGVPNAVALAGIVTLFGLIPLIGNSIAAVIVVLITAFTSWKLALIMGIYFPIYQQIENVTLYPWIQSRSNELTPLTVFLAALLGASFGGILGAFVAIPAAGCLMIIGKDLLTRRKSPKID